MIKKTNITKKETGKKTKNWKRNDEKMVLEGRKSSNDDNGKWQKTMSRELRQLETQKVQQRLEVALRREEKSQKEQKEQDEKAANSTASSKGARRLTSSERSDRGKNQISGGKKGVT